MGSSSSSNTSFATDQPKTALAMMSSDHRSSNEENVSDLVIDQVLQEMDIVLDDGKRRLLKSIPDSNATAEQVHKWAWAVANYRMEQPSLYARDTTWRGPDLHNCVLSVKDMDGNIRRPDRLTHTRCRLFDHQYDLSPPMRDELADDVVLLLHIRKAVSLRERRDEPRDESDLPILLVLCLLATLMGALLAVLSCHLFNRAIHFLSFRHT